MIQELIFGDCLEKFHLIQSKTIDLILCDLPYGVTQNFWDFIIPLDKLWIEYERVIKDNGIIVLTAIQPFTSLLVCSNLKLFKYEWIWKKNKARGFLNAKKQPLRNHESILIFYKSKPTYNPQKSIGHKPVNSYTKHTSDGTNYGKTKLDISGGGSTERYPLSVLEISVINNENDEKFHPNQKPLELFEYLIKTYSNENDLILDNCFGSGTTLVAAKRLNRQFIGIEKEEEYFNKTIERLKKY